MNNLHPSTLSCAASSNVFEKELQDVIQQRQTDIKDKQCQLAKLKQRLPLLTLRMHRHEQIETTKQIARLEHEIAELQKDTGNSQAKVALTPFIQAWQQTRVIQQIKSQYDKDALSLKRRSIRPVGNINSVGKKRKRNQQPSAGLMRFVQNSAAAQHQQAEQKRAAHDSTQLIKLKAEYDIEVGKLAPAIVIDESERCKTCNELKIYEPSQALQICPRCYKPNAYLDTTATAVAYGDEVEFTNVPYKKKNHFRDILIYSQWKETVVVPTAVLFKILYVAVHRDGYTKDTLINMPVYHVRDIMKFLGLKEYYRYKVQIYCRITGHKRPLMSPEQEEMNIMMFDAIQAPYRKHCPPTRRNFMSYGFFQYRFQQILGRFEFLKFYGLPKGQRKLAEHDEVFTKICIDLDWTLEWKTLSNVYPYLPEWYVQSVSHSPEPSEPGESLMQPPAKRSKPNVLDSHEREQNSTVQ